MVNRRRSSLRSSKRSIGSSVKLQTEPLPVPEHVIICPQCGDRGFDNAFVYCVKCLGFAIHRYCLPVIPETFDGFVHWLCDDCEEERHKYAALICEANACQTRDDKASEDTKEQVNEGGPQKCYDREEGPSTPHQTSDFIPDVKNISNISSIHDFQESPGPAPIMKPVWRGSFCMRHELHDSLPDPELVAHLSNRACEKVYEACRFDSELHMEVLPRSKIWPKSFDTSALGAENIALYFFPSKISERAYDHLVEEMFSEELAMRAPVQNAELLVFPSTELPIKHWRFQNKHYLWGVFRRKEQAVV